MVFLKNKNFYNLLYGIILFVVFTMLDRFLPFIGFPAGTLGYSIARLGYALVVMYLFFKLNKTDKIFSVNLNLNILNKIFCLVLIFLALAIYFILNNGFNEIVLIFSKNVKVILSVFSVALAAGIFEEFLTRGFFFKYFFVNNNSNNLVLPSIYSSLIFGMFHLYNLFFKDVTSTLQQVFYAAVIGLLFSALRIIFNGLFVTVLLHSLVDLQLNLVTPNINTPATPWLFIFIIFIPIAIISLITIFSLEKEKNLSNVKFL